MLPAYRISLVVGSMGYSFVAEHGLLGHLGFSSCGIGSSSREMWGSPGRGIEPMSPAPAGRLQTSGPPGKFCYALKDVSPVGFESKMFPAQVEQENHPQGWQGSLCSCLKSTHSPSSLAKQGPWLGFAAYHLCLPYSLLECC